MAWRDLLTLTAATDTLAANKLLYCRTAGKPRSNGALERLHIAQLRARPVIITCMRSLTLAWFADKVRHGHLNDPIKLHNFVT